MEEKLISKKDLLELTGISYGQLYRWKRKKIIPEEWFIKKSVSTGQETFFPLDKISKRIKEILALKDEISLDELAERFSNNMKNVEITRNYIIEQNIVTTFILENYEGLYGIKEKYTSKDIFLIHIFNLLVESAAVNFEEIKEIIIAVDESYSKLNEECKLLIKRKLGVLFYNSINGNEEIIIDKNAKIILELDFLKIKKNISEFI